MHRLEPTSSFPHLDSLSLSDLEGIRILLRGGSVIDWYRLNFESDDAIFRFLAAQELDPEDPADLARAETIKQGAIDYLKRHFDFPIPRPVAALDVVGLLRTASGKGHRQLCACAILKVMQIIQHLEARELLFMLPTSDEEVFHLVERKVYRIVGGALAAGAPIVEFIGGRKNRDSLYTKLLSKPDVTAAQIYDKLRFRVVTRSRDDIFPVLNFFQREVVPFNFTIPGQSTNTLIAFRKYCEAHPHLAGLLPRLQIDRHLEDHGEPIDNVFTSKRYRVVHFVVDMPVRLPEAILVEAPPSAWPLGRVIFVQTEFQILDQETDRQNQRGEASHAAYKARQNEAVMRRLEVGNLPHRKPDADDE
jgi:uncharacterized protein (TIGR04552 family)